MEEHTEIVDDPPEMDPKDARQEFSLTERIFTAQDIPKIVKIFRDADADGGGGLDIEEFCVAMKQLSTSVNDEELTALHMQIDTNCDLTVDLGELLDFVFDKCQALDHMDYKNHLFPKPIKITEVDHCKSIVCILFSPSSEQSGNDSDSAEQIRTYQTGHYISISLDGILNFWTDSVDNPHSIALYNLKEKLPFSHIKKMCVTDMVYVRELSDLAISTTDRELLFFNCLMFPETFHCSYSLIVEDNIVNAMNYWSDGTKAVFSFGDIKGYLTVFVSYDVKSNGLFCRDAFEKISLKNYPTVYVSSLHKNQSKDFLCFKISVFNDVVKEIRYFNSLESFGVCGSTSKTLVIIPLPKLPRAKIDKRVFESSMDDEFFTCVEYSPSTERLVSGGKDGLLRVWLTHKTSSCERTLKGHDKPVSHIVYNPVENVFISLSEDKNVRVWSEDGQWLCRQSFYADAMSRTSISSLCYNMHNNELLLANTDIGKYFGRGTDVFKDMLTSHDKPLCSAIYHSIFKQVISVCQNGEARVWDVLTGNSVMKFKISPDKNVGLAAISFDGPKRRLLTAHQEGRVRLWNFNNGTELDVLPVTVQREVTSIVCDENRVFVAGKNSNMIFDLDIEGYDNRFYEHEYLTDVSSMDVHGPTLVTASSNGNVVIWDTNTGEALYWLNINDSPRTHMLGRRTRGRTGSVPEKGLKNVGGTQKGSKASTRTEDKPDVPISPLIICLKTREVNVVTATLLTSADGYIYAWSVISKGGLIGKFRAVNDEGAVITTMSTDADEQILLTGESTGKIYLWDIRSFGLKNLSDKGPFENIDGWRVSLCPPPLLDLWRSHSTGVASVQCDPACKNVITAGLDCTVRLWSSTGCCLGLFGKDQWDAKQLTRESADQEQAESSGTTEARKSPAALPVTPESEDTSPPPEIIPNYSYLSEFKPDLLLPEQIPSFTQLCKDSRKWDKFALESDRSEEIHYGKDQLNIMDNSLISDAVQLTQSQSQFKPHPPHTDLKQSSPQVQTRPNCGSVLKIARRDTSEGTGLTPCPPKTLPDMTKRVRLPPISKKVQLAYHQTQVKPHPPQTTLTTGRTDPPKSSPQLAYHQTQMKPHPPQTTLTTGRTNPPKSSPRVTLPAGSIKQRSEETSEHQRFQSISNKVKLMHDQIRLQPHPPQTVEPASECTIERVGLPPISDKGRLTHRTQLKPQPPQTTFTTGRTNATKSSPRVMLPAGSVKQRSEDTSEHQRFPSISNKVKLTHDQTPLQPHPPQTVKPASERTTQRVHFTPTSDKGSAYTSDSVEATPASDHAHHRPH